MSRNSPVSSKMRQQLICKATPMAMALRTTLTRCLFFPPTYPYTCHLFLRSMTTASPNFFSRSSAAFSCVLPARAFCNSSETPSPNQRSSKLVNFSLPSDSDSDSETAGRKAATKEVDKSKLPPPYNPFNKKPAIEEPEDPKNLQEVFAKIREDGLMNSAVKMFDGLSQDGLTHEALELFSQIKDKGQMPDVVGHTAVMEAYVNAGQPKEAHKVYLRMLTSGVLPNAYTYRVLIKGLADSGDVKMVKEAKKYLEEMVGRGMRPNATTCVMVFEGLTKVGMEDEGVAVLEMLKEKSLAPTEDKLREALKNKRGPVNRKVMSVLYGK